MRKKRYLAFVLATSLFVGLPVSVARAEEPDPLGPGETVSSQAKLPSQSKINDVLHSADKYIGTPYQWGADPYSETNRYFDCSSFTQRVFKENGIILKRDSREQSTQGKTVVSVQSPEQFIGDGTEKPKGERLHFDEIRSKLKKGDLIFFDNEEETPNVEKIHHVAIYINEHTLLHATNTYGVNYTYFNEKRKNNIVIVKRMIEESIPPVTQSEIIATGEKYLGTPFSSDPEQQPGTMNASKFVRDVFAEHGIPLPGTANDMSKAGIDIPKDQLKMGDLVFFDNDHDGIITHVAIYVNENKLLHATVSKGVTYTTFSSYWQDAYVKGKRILDLKGPLPLNEEVFKTAVTYVGKKQIEDIEPDENGQPKLVTPDSSKFVQKVFYDHYVGMSRTSNTQQTQGRSVSLSNAVPGDLVFFDSDQDGSSNYVAFYVDSDTILLSSSSEGIKYRTLTESMKKEIMAIRRIGL
ncbi:C40 family peptidase [Paenactinomyces guangxiensis]|uniref:C40 family peptidase n=1 Tax=Paenactinomyces guangxiensis TaxID=1490290 RepID=A0A7W1WQR0_9BACL|nr:NlpC/P60 family protein [Paenactinomyces guangxiensis]MBA4494141.1 C40 family peptidase [Paenactinomyces guangxiensis]MBH8591114.1 C40 family peptidase [Paenactinomyces guangxiensis]